MWMLLARGFIAGAVIVGVTAFSSRSPRTGAFLLMLPLVSVLAFLSTWQQVHDLPRISQVARETLILVPLGLPLLIPLAFAQRLGLGFWTAFASGLVLASASVGQWLWFEPRNV